MKKVLPNPRARTVAFALYPEFFFLANVTRPRLASNILRMRHRSAQGMIAYALCHVPPLGTARGTGATRSLAERESSS